MEYPRGFAHGIALHKAGKVFDVATELAGRRRLTKTDAVRVALVHKLERDFAYACAKAHNARRLYKGDDYARTDLA